MEARGDALSTKREELLLLCTVFEEAERYEERNLFSVAFKNLIGPKRASWRILSSIEQKEEANHDNHKVLMIREYKEQIERELEEVCNRVICIVDTHILPHNQSSEAQCFFFKLKADHYRYAAEIFTNEQKNQYSSMSLASYNQASAIALTRLPPTHPIRLGMSLSFATQHYELLGQPELAIQIAKQAFDAAVAELDTLSEDSYKDSCVIMSLLRDNLTLWTGGLQSDDDIPEVKSVTVKGQGDVVVIFKLMYSIEVFSVAFSGKLWMSQGYKSVLVFDPTQCTFSEEETNEHSAVTFMTTIDNSLWIFRNDQLKIINPINNTSNTIQLNKTFYNIMNIIKLEEEKYLVLYRDGIVATQLQDKAVESVISNICNSKLMSCMCVVRNTLWGANVLGEIFIWDLKNFSLLKTFKGHNLVVNSMINFAGKVWTASSDSTIKLWTYEGTCIKTIPSTMGRVLCMIEGNGMVWTGGDYNGVIGWSRAGNPLVTLDIRSIPKIKECDAVASLVCVQNKLCIRVHGRVLCWTLPPKKVPSLVDIVTEFILSHRELFPKSLDSLPSELQTLFKTNSN